MELEILCRPFHDLPLLSWYHISQLRERVFVVEQQCNYIDSDGIDPQCFHMEMLNDGQLVGYCRLLPPKQFKYLSQPVPSIGRVIMVKEYRGKGLGKRLMKAAIEEVRRRFEDQSIFIAAQSQHQVFYGDLGFSIIGEEYMIDHIPHYPMLLDNRQ